MDTAGHTPIFSIPCRIHWNRKSLVNSQEIRKHKRCTFVIWNYEEVIFIKKLKAAGKRVDTLVINESKEFYGNIEHV
jgi:hypothetical protein